VQDSDPDSTASAAVRSSGKAIAFDRAADYYDRTRGYPEGVAERVAELLCQAGSLGAQSRVLEVGIGTGRVALPLAARVGCLAGVDLARPMLERLLEKPSAHRTWPLLADITALPFGGARFDAVVGVHIFHLVPGWRLALAEIKRVLVPGGVLLLASDDWALRELWQAARAELPSYESAGVPATERDFPLQEGFHQTAKLELRYAQTVEFREFVRQVEERVWSSTWNLSDADHARLISAMRAAIVQRYGDLGAVIEIERGVTVCAFAPD
jgi:SAM-dependent methyltransferase